MQPTSFDSLHGLLDRAMGFERQGAYDAALDALRRAWMLHPKSAQVAYRMAVVAQLLGDYQGSLNWAVQAIRLKEDFWDAYLCMAAALQRLDRFDEAARAYHSLLMVWPEDPRVNRNLGGLCVQLGLRADAIRYFERAAAALPDRIDLEGEVVQQLLHVNDWPNIDDRVASLLRRMRHEDVWTSPFSTLALPGASPEDLRRAAEHHTRKLVQPTGLPTGRDRDPERPIRLGYLSSDFHDHATSYLMVRLFELHDRSRFRLYAYSWDRPEPGAMRARIEAAFDEFRDIRGDSDEGAAARISADAIDILVDLKGFTRDGRLGILGHRPAPVQVHHVGFPGTLGAPFVDYLIADRFVAPPEHAAGFREALAYLPHCYQPTDPTRPIGPRPTRAECGLPETGTVFASFNQAYKITPRVFELWCRLLQEVPGSALWLLEWNTESTKNLRAEAERRGVHRARLVVAPQMPQTSHLGRMQNADIVLDTRPVNGHTTASDALWAGVPVVTYPGETFVSRVAGSILTTLGLSELIATSEDDYVRIARDLGTDGKRLADVKRRIDEAKRASPLFDCERYTRDLEAVYREMWRRYVDGLAPLALDKDGIVAAD